MRLKYVALFALLSLTSNSVAQDVPLQVLVNDDVYLVQGSTVTAEKGGTVDAITARKAMFAARVLDEQILKSDFNRQLFDANNRAEVFSAEASGRLAEPWRRALNGAVDEKALAAAKTQFKTWTAKLASDPKELVLAVARKDYADSISAYRENAAIYRKVMRQNEILSYEEASRFLDNHTATSRLVAARALEEQVSASASATADQALAGKLSQRLQAEAGGDIDAARSPADFDKRSTAIRQIALTEISPLRAYNDSIRPATIRFSMPGSNAAAPAAVAAPGGVTTTITGQNTVSITVPPQPAFKNAKPFDFTGGIMPSPYPLNRAPAAGGNPPPGAPAAPGGNNPSAGGGTGAPGGGAAGAGAPASGGAGVGGAAAAGGGVNVGTPGAGLSPGSNFGAAGGLSGGSPSTPSAQAAIDIGSDENLKTYSSKPYHSDDGWVWNPRDGLWHNPRDASQTRIPSVITCCDDTGLAFPNEAVEAKQTYEYDPGGTDPNCNRLYRCGPVKPPVAGPTDDPGSKPTDRDGEIQAALDYLNGLDPKDKGPAISKFLNKLPKPYHTRAINMLRGMNNGMARTPRLSRMAPTRMSSVSGGVGSGGPRMVSHLYREPSGPQSTITSRNTFDRNSMGNTARYEPITKSAATNIVGTYKSIPGGVTLEGASDDLTFVKKVMFLKQANAFVINDDLLYLNPVPAAEYTEIEAALAKDDKLGVSLGEMHLVYGALSPRSGIALKLKIADRLLGSIVFVNRSYTGGYNPAPGYRSELPRVENVAVYFNFSGYRFAQDTSGELSRERVELKTTLVPLTAKKNSDGGHLPDFARIERGDLPEIYVANLKNIQDHFDYYAREKIIRQTIAYGEAAAFARSLKSNNVKPEIR